MLQRIPRLGRTDVVLNSFGSCIADAPEKFSWTPKMSFCEIVSEPRMFRQKFKGAVAFKQLKCLAYRHSWWQLNKQMYMVNSDVKLVDMTSIFDCNFMDEAFTIDANTKKFERVHGIFTFPNKMESILPEGMCKRLQIHFFPPCLGEDRRAHAKRLFNFREGNVNPLSSKEFQKLNLVEEGNSSLGLKAEVSLPFM